MKKKQKRWSVLLIVSMFLIFWNGYIHHPENEQGVSDVFSFPEDSLNFDMHNWTDPSDSLASVRQYMLKDLINNHLKEGLDTLVIKDLLGEPLPLPRTAQKHYYHIQHESVTPLYLVIDWDQNGKATKYSIRTLQEEERHWVAGDLTVPE